MKSIWKRLSKKSLRLDRKTDGGDISQSTRRLEESTESKSQSAAAPTAGSTTPALPTTTRAATPADSTTTPVLGETTPTATPAGTTATSTTAGTGPVATLTTVGVTPESTAVAVAATPTKLANLSDPTVTDTERQSILEEQDDQHPARDPKAADSHTERHLIAACSDEHLDDGCDSYCYGQQFVYNGGKYGYPVIYRRRLMAAVPVVRGMAMVDDIAFPMFFNSYDIPVVSASRQASFNRRQRLVNMHQRYTSMPAIRQGRLARAHTMTAVQRTNSAHPRRTDGSPATDS